MQNSGNAKLIYVLYLASLIFGITSLIGLVMAYVNQTDSGDPINSHYQFQIRTFWIGLLIGIIGGITTLILIGWLILLFLMLWLIIRCVKGLKIISEGKPIENPKSWMFG